MGGVMVTLLASCNKENNEDIKSTSPEMNITAEQYFNIVYSSSTTGNTGTYIQAFTNPFKGTISFTGFGYEVPSTRTARVFASNDGKTIYNLDYGGGSLSSFDVLGAQDYRLKDQLNVLLTMGTEYPRGTKFSDTNMLIHTVKTEKAYKDEEETEYDYFRSTARIANVDLTSLSIDKNEWKDIELYPITKESDSKQGLYISRIDAPTVIKGKAYYGFSMSSRDEYGDRPDGTITPKYNSQTLVVDYPALTNAKLTTSTLSKGSTYGYRIPVSHADEKGDVYQISATHMLKLTNGEYDNSYDFNLTAAAGVEAKGWFYVGNGIGYATTYDPTIGASSTLKAWGITRVDIYNKTAIEMNVADELSLGQYQMAKVGKDGKLYMALAPVGKEGNIYIFDPKKADANGFELGAKLLSSGVDNSYIGIF